MNTLLSYDVSHKHAEIKAALKKLGYYDYWTQDDTVYNLPDATLFKPDTELAQSLKDIQSIVTALNFGTAVNRVILKRCIVTPAQPWTGIPGNADR